MMVIGLREGERGDYSRAMPKPLFFVSVLVVWLLAEAPAQAYLDPGSGSMLLQLLLGGFAAVGVIGKLYWNRVASFFGRKETQQPPMDPPAGS
jgi:hypothetical protein